jgi:hypothetical protein
MHKAQKYLNWFIECASPTPHDWKKQSEKECKLKNFYAIYNVLFCKCSVAFGIFSLLPLVLYEEHQNESNVRKRGEGRKYKIYDDVSKTINECKNVINSITIISDFVERRMEEKKGKILIYSSAVRWFEAQYWKLLNFCCSLKPNSFSSKYYNYTRRRINFLEGTLL